MINKPNLTYDLVTCTMCIVKIIVNTYTVVNQSVKTMSRIENNNMPVSARRKYKIVQWKLKYIVQCIIRTKKLKQNTLHLLCQWTLMVTNFIYNNNKRYKLQLINIFLFSFIVLLLSISIQPELPSVKLNVKKCPKNGQGGWDQPLQIQGCLQFLLRKGLYENPIFWNLLMIWILRPLSPWTVKHARKQKPYAWFIYKTK